MYVTELVISNSGGELGRYDVTVNNAGNVSLITESAFDEELMLVLKSLQVGDTLQIVERWSEDVK